LDENQASTGARAVHGSLLHLWKGRSAAVASEFDALRYCCGAGGAWSPSAAPVVWDQHEGLRPKQLAMVTLGSRGKADVSSALARTTAIRPFRACREA